MGKRNSKGSSKKGKSKKSREKKTESNLLKQQENSHMKIFLKCKVEQNKTSDTNSDEGILENIDTNPMKVHQKQVRISTNECYLRK